MEFLRFIFSSFWIWCGFVIILVILGEIIVDFLQVIFGRKDKNNEQTNKEETDEEIEL